MKISSIESSNHYSPLANKAKVYLNGILQDYAIFADEENGLIISYFEKDGELMLDESGSLITIRTIGNVKIVI